MAKGYPIACYYLPTWIRATRRYTVRDGASGSWSSALARAKRRLDGRPDGPKILTLNAWNEWTEGSYLEPGTECGLAYLAAIQDVF